MKTAAAMLYEFCTEMGRTVYSEVEQDSRSGKFICRLTVGDVNVTAEARNKKLSKHLAAKEMLDELSTREHFVRAVMKTVDVVIPGLENNESFEDEANAVAILHQLCQAQNWPAPVYLFTGENEGDDLEQRFTMVCKLFKNSTYGFGSKKSFAKREAAKKMLKQIEDSGLVRSVEEKLKNANGKSKGRRLCCKCCACNDGFNCCLDRSPQLPVDAPFRYRFGEEPVQRRPDLWTLKGKLLTEILEKPTEEFFKMWYRCDMLLYEVAIEQRFMVEFQDVEELQPEDECPTLHVCLVYILTEPVIVGNGHGCNSREAKNDAARSALFYIRSLKALASSTDQES